MKRFGLAVGILLGGAAGLLLAPPEVRTRLRTVGQEVADLVGSPFQELAQSALARLRQPKTARDTYGPCAPTL